MINLVTLILIIHTVIDSLNMKKVESVTTPIEWLVERWSILSNQTTICQNIILLRVVYILYPHDCCTGLRHK